MRESYRRCREINARNGKTFFLATRLLAPRQRPAVHALYGFARRADDILDDFDARSRRRAARASNFSSCPRSCSTAWWRIRPCDDDPTLTAVVHTARKYDIGWDLFDDFLASMRMDLTVTDYPDRPALERYMYGSAEVIGLQLLPDPGHRRPAGRRSTARGRARKGVPAHQLHQGCRRRPAPWQGVPARRRARLPRRRPGAAELVPNQSAHRSPRASGAGRATRDGTGSLRAGPAWHRDAEPRRRGRVSRRR